jgi:hypothetical protein
MTHFFDIDAADDIVSVPKISRAIISVFVGDSQPRKSLLKGG